MLGIRLVSRTRKYSDIGLWIGKKKKRKEIIRVAITDQFYPLIQAEDGSSSPVTRGGSREMRALLTTLLFWGIMVSAPLVWKRTRLCQSYYRPLRHRKPGSRCDTTGRPWEWEGNKVEQHALRIVSRFVLAQLKKVLHRKQHLTVWADQSDKQYSKCSHPPALSTQLLEM